MENIEYVGSLGTLSSGEKAQISVELRKMQFGNLSKIEKQAKFAAVLNSIKKEREKYEQDILTVRCGSNVETYIIDQQKKGAKE